MKLEEVTAEIRPRGDWEAADLGFALARRDFWRCLGVWWLAMGVPLAVAGVLLAAHPFWLALLVWWFKPAASRLVLFVLSRRLFGERPGWRAVAREIPRAWTRRFAYRFLWARLSPWQPVTLPVEDLEGLRGKSFQQRAGQLVRRGDSAVMWLSFLSVVTSAWLALGIGLVLAMMLPEGLGGAWSEAMQSWDGRRPLDVPPLIAWTSVGCGLLAVSLTDLFVTGAGFGIYLNNRTWLEGWDVELAFRRLAQRLGGVALMVLVGWMMAVPAHGEETDATPKDRIREIKAAPEFVVHTVKERVPKPKDVPGDLPVIALPGLELAVQVITWTVVAAGVGFVVVMLLRHWPKLRLGGPDGAGGPETARARVVMGMPVSRDSLPGDIPAAAWNLWSRGERQAALGLLYRGAISRVVETGRVGILESDTEGDCVRRVEEAGSVASPDYFRGLTGIWTRLAYAGILPGDDEVRVLCDQWPFDGRRSA